VKDSLRFLKEGDDCIVRFFEEKPISMEPRPKVALKVIKTINAVKGDTATGATKKATLETGVVIDVPLFVKENDNLIVNTESGTYVSKA
jgi:elongation factor P